MTSWPRSCFDRQDVTHARITLGKIGEDLACRALERRGYEIIARRYRRRGGEVDIIARDGEAVVFVEVKAREGRRFGEAAEAVTWTKRCRLTQVALDYLARQRLSGCACRFDVVSVQVGSGEPIVEVYKNAFEATGSW